MKKTFCEDAIEGLKQFQKSIKTYDNTFIKAIRDRIFQAQKFKLPGYVLFDDGLKNLPEKPRLPFPLIALEYTVPLKSHNKDLEVSTKRISIAEELAEDNFVIYSAYYADDLKKWITLPFCLSIITGYIPEDDACFNPDGIVTKDNNSIILKSMGMKILKLSEDPVFDIMSPQEAYDNLVDEVRAVFELIEALTCVNVSYDIESKRKIKYSGNMSQPLPFDAYRTLMVDTKAGRVAISNALMPEEPEDPTERRKARTHLRRGHIKTIRGVKYWWNAHVVNAKVQGGFVHKDYQVK